MSNLELTPLAQEWVTLQNNHEQYEKGGLLIKLFAIALCAAGLGMALQAWLLALLLAVLWLQEGIFRTFQARLGRRILLLESYLRSPDSKDICAFQLHSEWWSARPGSIGLLNEYGASALRPTVAYPYLLLLILTGLPDALAGA